MMVHVMCVILVLTGTSSVLASGIHDEQSPPVTGSDLVQTDANRVDLAHDSRHKQLQGGDIVYSSQSGAAYRLREMIHTIGQASGSTGPLVVRPPGTLTPFDAGTLQCQQGDDVCMWSKTAQEHEAAIEYALVRRKRAKGWIKSGDAGVHEEAPPEPAGAYNVEDLIGKGAHGEVWKASRLDVDGEEEEGFVIKRLFHDKPAALLSGFREIYFGILPFVRESSHFCRYVEHWQADRRDNSHEESQPELWIVFRDEGTSLQRLLYQPVAVGARNAQYHLEGSLFWTRLRSESAGKRLLRTMVQQLISGAAILHHHDILHRDIKSSNIIVGLSEGKMNLRFADFGSAVDAYSIAHYYTDVGPTQDEETLDYAPPEVRFGSIPYWQETPASYDMFSIGVVILELLYGLPPWQLFQVTSREAAMIRKRMENLHDDVIETQLMKAAFEKMCVRDNCTLKEFAAMLDSLDEEAHVRLERSLRQAKEQEAVEFPSAILGPSSLFPSLPSPGARNYLVPVPFMGVFPAPARVDNLFDQFALVPAASRSARFTDDDEADSGNAVSMPSAAQRRTTAPTKAAQIPGVLSLLGEAGVDLLYRLLRSSPMARVTAADALEHIYFAGA